jgi:hypothetical protein
MLRPNRRLVWIERRAYAQKHAGQAKRDEKRVASSQHPNAIRGANRNAAGPPEKIDALKTGDKSNRKTS